MKLNNLPRFARATAFKKEFLSSSEPLRVVGAHDGLGALLAERHGFDGVWASGLEISTSHGVPDANILSMTQYLERSQEMITASRLPVIADVDTGYGNSSNVHFMVRQYEAAGVAAIVIEDKLFPKVNSFAPGRQELASIPEFCGKLEAAKAAQETEDFMVIARIEALIAGWGLDEALRRGEAFLEAGADAILIHSKSRSPDEVRSFLDIWNQRAPMVLIPTTYPSLTFDEMRDRGVNMVIYANHGLRATVSAMDAVLSSIAEHRSTVQIEDSITPVKTILELQGMKALKAHEKTYMRRQKPIRAIVPAFTGSNEWRESSADNGPIEPRIVETLRRAAIDGITVLTHNGFHPDEVDSVDLHRVEGSPPGLVNALTHLSIDQDSVLIHRDGIVVCAETLGSFCLREEPVVAMISPVEPTAPLRDNVDVVSLRSPMPPHGRTLEAHRSDVVTGAGHGLPRDQLHGELIGLILLNGEGIAHWREAATSFAADGRPTDSLGEFLAYLLGRGIEITTFEARSGWVDARLADPEPRAPSADSPVSGS